jgi:small subunit ribosomal protein S7
MSRRNRAPKRDILPDPKFDSILLSKFINMTMMSGKKSVAEKIIYGAIDIISDRSGKDDQEAISLLTAALDNIKPSVEVKSRRVGGATYQIPVEVRSVRRETLAMRWVIDSARKRNEKTMAQRVAGELMDASENRGSAVKKREEVHKMAEANKAFAHFRW